MSDKQIDDHIDVLKAERENYVLEREELWEGATRRRYWQDRIDAVDAAIMALERQRVPENRLPWHDKLLSEWSIVGMNHYHINGERFLFVSLCKDGYCIKEEGRDDKYLWNRLWHKANASPAAPELE